MTSPKITLVKNPSTGNIEVCIEDSIYAIPGVVYVMPKEGLSLQDVGSEYREEIKMLQKRLAKAQRAKKHILNNLRKES